MTRTLTDRRIHFNNTHSVGALDHILMGRWMDRLLWTLNQMQWLLNIELFKYTIECGTFEMTWEEAAKLLFRQFSRAAKFTSRPASQCYAARERFCGFYIRIFNIKITQKFRRLGLPLTIIFTCAAREPAHNMGCDSLQKKK